MDRVKIVASHVLGAGPCSSSQLKPLKNFINGAFVESLATSCVEKQNPATGEVIALVPESTRADVDKAVIAAAEAFKTWSVTPVKTRVEVLFKFKELAEKHIKELAALAVMEHGKNIGEAEAEVLKGIETVAFASGLPDLLAGRTLEVSRGVYCQETHRPLGVVASIVPFNFPAMVPLWTLPIAVGCGNCLIMKPSEKVPLTLMRMIELLHEAGCPKGVVSLVHGTKEVVTSLAEHPGIAGISFVGSSPVADIVDKAARKTGKRSVCMGGAKNHLIAMPDMDEDMAINDMMNSAFGSAGQRCMAASVLLVVGKGRKAFLEKLVARASQLKPGQAVGEIGPLIDVAAAKRVTKYIEEAGEYNAQILLDGRGWQKLDRLKGNSWMGPTILLHKTAKEPAIQEEIFGPVLSVLEVDTLEEAIAIENSNPYGNAAAIYTTSGQTSLEVEKLTAGMIGINIGVPVPREPFSFGGIRKSKFGDSCDITGQGAIDFWTEKIKITSKWKPPLTKDVVSSSFIS